MSNLCSRIVSKPTKRLQDSTNSMSVTQTNTWMNGELLVNIDLYQL